MKQMAFPTAAVDAEWTLTDCEGVGYDFGRTSGKGPATLEKANTGARHGAAVPVSRCFIKD
jgi:hypothetical protein